MLVRGAGIEPARPFGHSILSAARLPVTTSAHVLSSCFYHDEWVEDYDNLDKVFVDFLFDYPYYHRLYDPVQVVLYRQQIPEPIHIIHTQDA